MSHPHGGLWEGLGSHTPPCLHGGIEDLAAGGGCGHRHSGP